MRWQYIFDEADADYARKNGSLSLINAWWSAFEDKADALNESMRAGNINAEETSAWVDCHLHPVHEKLMWELEKTSTGSHFVITAEQEIGIRCLTNTVVQRAPKIAGWSFSAYRTEEDPTMLEQAFYARAGCKLPGNLGFVLTKTQANQIDLEVQSSSFSSKDTPQDLTAAVVLATVALGEENIEKWLNFIHASKPASGGIFGLFGRSHPSHTQLIGLSSLATTFRQLKQEILGSLPEQPLYRVLQPEDSPCAVLQAKGLTPTAKDFPDRMVSSTMAPNIALAAWNSMRFFSECHSRCGEIFCYLKIDRPEGIEDPVSVRSHFEVNIDNALRQYEIGCVTGGGFGPIHDFIDIAAVKVPECVSVLRQICREASMPPSRLLFNDAHLKDEWVSIT